ncbi:MAG: hypothetical protein IPH12_11780 [Saprospirales bacterium]|nr:hypothetical protein [Saprospirales bacterium]
MRFWTALDASNNVATCVQTISRQRLLNDVQFPSDTLLSCSLGLQPEVSGGPYVEVGSRRYPLLTAPLCAIEITYADSVETICGGSRRVFQAGWSGIPAWPTAASTTCPECRRSKWWTTSCQSCFAQQTRRCRYRR